MQEFLFIQVIQGSHECWVPATHVFLAPMCPSLPRVKTLRGGAFERCLGHEGGALVNEISTVVLIIKETHREIPCPPFYHVRI